MQIAERYHKQRRYFENMLKHDDLGHAYLFTGQDAAGKKFFAEDVCVLLTGKRFENNPNLKFIYPGVNEEKYSIDVGSIRELKSFMYLKPHSSEYKLAVIENAEMISIAAANAMLKILEEPPQKSVLVLISSKPKLLPRTILSRCETVVFSPAPETQTEEMSKALAELRKVARYGMAERIKYAKTLHEKENYAELVGLWLRSLRFQLSAKPASAPILRRLLNLSYIVSQPQYNHRLALENFLVQL
ncbi:MAG: hypothetical protein HYX22_00995 [Candidatus Yanofskybacteria bacterium]|nr:hypothetical protein [Candidatus Yanofskybacteria bacterium]